jgi:hypothetical protein
MVSSQLHQAEVNLDEQISPADTDFIDAGLKTASLLRLSRLAVLANELKGSDPFIAFSPYFHVYARIKTWRQPYP